MYRFTVGTNPNDIASLRIDFLNRLIGLNLISQNIFPRKNSKHTGHWLSYRQDKQEVESYYYCHFYL
ncbi:hypothetical protein BES34_004315 [Leptospira inadai serovar Lyme]|uniref:Uncharacterized protein n=1 Tax=Leptospira inadai serovar Lyme TaxID=293084 RepID=A0ABX4YM60_9LEPT|nr:hypothetical protein BES34_004315 [Leptospira inadai serovar Lyme]